MKKEYLIFDAYIKTVSKDIKDRKVKRELKEELFSHLIEIYERNIALGMSDEDAQKDAVSHMGDSVAVAKTFKKLYPVSSFEYFKTAGKLFAFALVYYILTCGTLRGFDAIFGLSVWLLSALNRIKKINKIINTAYIITYINTILQFVFFIVRQNFVIDEILVIAISLIVNLILVIIYIITICGLIKVRKQLKEEKTYVGLGIASVVAIIIVFIIISLQIFTKENLGLSFLAAFISLLPAGLMYTIVTEDIDRLETGVPQEKKPTIKNWIVFIVIFGLLTASMFTSKIFTYYQPIDYVVEDTQTEISEIKNNLISLGLPQSIADELPESEILKYSGATELQIDELPEDTFSESYYTSYNFTLQKDSNIFIVRSLMVIDKFEDFDEDSYTEFFIDYYRYDSSDIFCKMLCDFDGVTKELKVLKNAPIADDKFKDYHYIFPNTKNVENHRAYIGMTVTIAPSTDIENFTFRHYYAQTSLDEINDPYESYYLRDDDRFFGNIQNPYYDASTVSSEDTTTDEVLPWLDGSIGFEPSEEIYDIDELIEYYNP